MHRRLNLSRKARKGVETLQPTLLAEMNTPQFDGGVPCGETFFFPQYLLSTYHRVDTVQGAGHTLVNEGDKLSAFLQFIV